jgi:small subunit ribosomal protein S20
VRAQRNRSVRSSVKTKVTKFRRGIAEGADEAPELASVAVSALDRAVSKGVLHRNNAGRRKPRVMKRLNATAEAVQAPAPSAKGGRSKGAAAKASSTKATAPRPSRTKR